MQMMIIIIIYSHLLSTFCKKDQSALQEHNIGIILKTTTTKCDMLWYGTSRKELRLILHLVLINTEGYLWSVIII